MRGDWEEASKRWRKSLDLSTKLAEESGTLPSTVCLANWAEVLIYRGKLVEASKVLENVIGREHAVLQVSPNNPFNASVLAGNNYLLSGTLAGLGKEAESVQRRRVGDQVIKELFNYLRNTRGLTSARRLCSDVKYELELVVRGVKNGGGHGAEMAVCTAALEACIQKLQKDNDVTPEELTKAIEQTPDDWELRQEHGILCVRQARWKEAAADLVKVIELNPGDSKCWLDAAPVLILAEDRAAYRTACQQMLERFGQTKNPIIAHRIALSCLLIPQAVSDEKLVWQLAEQSLAGAPSHPWCLITLGMALYRAGQFEVAGPWGQIVKTWPDDPYAGAGADGVPLLTWLVLAMAHHRLGHTEEARRWLDKAVQRMDAESAAKEIGPLRQQSHVWAMCLVLRREAQELLSKAVTDLPSRTVRVPRHNPYMGFALGLALAAKGLCPEAIAEFRKVTEMKPDFAEAYNCLAWLLATHSNPQVRDPDGAVHWAKKAVELAPNGGNWNTLGVAHYRAGAWKAALAALEKSVELRQGGDSFDWFFLAMCHEKLGDKEKARQWYDKAVEWMDKNWPQNDDLRRFRTEAAELLKIKKGQ